jgi:hypothetical protein
VRSSVRRGLPDSASAVPRRVGGHCSAVQPRASSERRISLAAAQLQVHVEAAQEVLGVLDTREEDGVDGGLVLPEPLPVFLNGGEPGGERPTVEVRAKRERLDRSRQALVLAPDEDEPGRAVPGADRREDALVAIDPGGRDGVGALVPELRIGRAEVRVQLENEGVGRFSVRHLVVGAGDSEPKATILMGRSSRARIAQLTLAPRRR